MLLHLWQNSFSQCETLMYIVKHKWLSAFTRQEQQHDSGNNNDKDDENSKFTVITATTKININTNNDLNTISIIPVAPAQAAATTTTKQTENCNKYKVYHFGKKIGPPPPLQKRDGIDRISAVSYFFLVSI